jgi:hypothetical protein
MEGRIVGWQSYNCVPWLAAVYHILSKNVGYHQPLESSPSILLQSHTLRTKYNTIPDRKEAIRLREEKKRFRVLTNRIQVRVLQVHAHPQKLRNACMSCDFAHLYTSLQYILKPCTINPLFFSSHRLEGSYRMPNIQFERNWWSRLFYTRRWSPVQPMFNSLLMTRVKGSVATSLSSILI